MLLAAGRRRRLLCRAAAAAAVPHATPNHPDASGAARTAATTPAATPWPARLHHLFFVTTANATMTIIYTARLQRLLADRLRRRIAVDKRAAIIVLHQHPVVVRRRNRPQQARVGRGR